MNILVLCTGNSCRSQMAHGFLKKYANNNQKIFSAGVEIHGINKDAVSAMKRIGIDISNHTSNHVDEYNGIYFSYVITVCNHAAEVCPIFPDTVKTIHHNFSDPSKFIGNEKEKIALFDEVRDEIEVFCKNFIQQTKNQTE
jgi:arsenate reductase (thioredoxin)